MPLRNLRSARCWHTCFSASEALTSNMEIRCRHCVVLHHEQRCSQRAACSDLPGRSCRSPQGGRSASQRRSHARNTHCGKNAIGTLQGCDKSLPGANRATHVKHEEEKGPSKSRPMVWGVRNPAFIPTEKNFTWHPGNPHADCQCSMQARSMQTQGQRDVQRAACRTSAAKMAEVCQAG